VLASSPDAPESVTPPSVDEPEDPLDPPLDELLEDPLDPPLDELLEDPLDELLDPLLEGPVPLLDPLEAAPEEPLAEPDEEPLDEPPEDPLDPGPPELPLEDPEELTDASIPFLLSPQNPWLKWVTWALAVFPVVVVASSSYPPCAFDQKTAGVSPPEQVKLTLTGCGKVIPSGPKSKSWESPT